MHVKMTQSAAEALGKLRAQNTSAQEAQPLHTPKKKRDAKKA